MAEVPSSLQLTALGNLLSSGNCPGEGTRTVSQLTEDRALLNSTAQWGFAIPTVAVRTLRRVLPQSCGK